MIRNPQAHKLRPFWQGQAIRLSESDRAFFQGLARVRIVALPDADQFYYKSRKSGAQSRLAKFVKLGLLEKRLVHHPGQKSYYAYSFANDFFAKAWGGKCVTLGAKRSSLHEVIVSKLYFSAGCPESFRLESQLSSAEKAVFRPKGAQQPMVPDAVFQSEAGQLVAVEADSGQYNQRQVRHKMSAWSGIQQIWGQPKRASARIQTGNGVSVVRF